MKINERKNGTVRIESIAEGERCYGRIEYETPDPFMIEFPESGISRPAVVGDEGCLTRGAAESESDTDASLYHDLDGIPGNCNQAVKRLDGWRGTTDGWRVTADGWRQVLSVEPRKRGVGWVVILSAKTRAGN